VATLQNERGELWTLTNDLLAQKKPDGSPDYTDPNVFPVLWPVEKSVRAAA